MLQLNVGKPFGIRERQSTIKLQRDTGPISVQVLKLRCCARHLPAIERPHCDSLLSSTLAAEITAAGYSNYTKNRSQAARPPILDALFPPTLKAFPVSGLQCLNLALNDASLHLTKNGFAFFQRETYLFRSDSSGFSFHLCH
jgi:hypothetical protein